MNRPKIEVMFGNTKVVIDDNYGEKVAQVFINFEEFDVEKCVISDFPLEEFLEEIDDL